MSLLSPWTALLAALIAIPLLILLYVLKLRRRMQRFSSTLLWQRSFKDVQANVPMQRLHPSWLLALQLLLLLLLVLALGEPVLHSAEGSASRVILLVDNSASMNAADGSDTAEDGPVATRLAAAKRQAQRIVQRLARGRSAMQVMVVSVGAAPRVVQGFDGRRDVLLDAIASIPPTDETADLAAALQLAGAFARQGEVQEQMPDVVFLSDGGVAPPRSTAGFNLPAGRFRYVQVGPEPGEPVQNVGFVSLSARRDHAEPTRVLVFARLANAGAAASDVLVALRVDDEPGPIETVRVPPAGAEGPGEATVTFAVPMPSGGVISLRHAGGDALAADDTAASVLPAPAQPRIAIVHGGDGVDPFLRDLLEGLEPAALREMSAEAFAGFDPVAIDAAEHFDLLVFDRVAPQRLAGVPSIIFGAVPPGVDVVPPATPGGRHIVSWQRRHPVMRHVELDTIVYAGFGAMLLPPGATELARGPEGAVIALLGARGADHAVVGFAMGRSNWALHVSVAVFLQNLVDHLTLARSGAVSRSIAPGEPASVRVAPATERLHVRGGGIDLQVPLPPGGGPVATLPPLPAVGLYEVLGALPPDDRIAVSMLSDVETDIRPAGELLVNAEARRAGEGDDATPQPLWPWLVAAALLLLVMEWLVYCRRWRT